VIKHTWYIFEDFLVQAIDLIRYDGSAYFLDDLSDNAQDEEPPTRIIE
jgi:hypothetical protein